MMRGKTVLKTVLLQYDRELSEVNINASYLLNAGHLSRLLVWKTLGSLMINLKQVVK